MHIAIIGKSFSGFKSYLDENNHSYVLFKNIDKRYPDSTNNIVGVDFSNIDSLFSAVRKSHSERQFDLVLTLYEQFILVTALVAENIDLPGLPIEAARACTDKSIMRALFSKVEKKISPDFMKVDSWEEVLSFVEHHKFPLILKPANLAKSLLVTKNCDIEELKTNYYKMIKNIERVYQKYAPLNERIILIEEFLEGSIHSVDAYVDNEGTPVLIPFIVDYKSGYDIGYDDNFHYSRVMPSVLSEDLQKEFFETADIAIRSLGMKNSAAHVEIIVTKAGPRIVEIGARNGGYRDRMHKLSQGIDIYGNLVALLSGEKVNVKAIKNESSAVLELFPKESGYFVGISNDHELRKLSSFVSISVKYKPGEFTGKSSDGYKAACVICLHNPDSEQFHRDLEFVTQSVLVRTS
jgi:phosphoribosylamine-glycine ligase